MLTLPDDVRQPIEEGMVNRWGGEVVVRSNAVVGRIYVYGGAVAWVNCASISSRLPDVLEEVAGVSRSDLGAVVEECQKTGAQFGETLVRWGLVDRETLRQCLRIHNARHLSGVAQLASPRMAMFIPQQRSYAADFLFSLNELLSAEPPPPPDPRTFIDARATEVLERAMLRLPNCQLVTLVDLARCDAIVSQPREPDTPLLAQGVSELAEQWLSGESVTRLETELHARGLDRGHLGQRLLATTEDAAFVLIRSPSFPTLALGAVCGMPCSLGLVLGMASTVVADIEQLIPEGAAI